MARTLQAVYEKGVLRPLEPLSLAEDQQVTVTIEGPAGNPLDSWIDHDYHAALSACDRPEPALEEVHAALSSIRGSLSDAVRTERDARS